ncbi:MAG: methyl-accepting chemotaxis protein [Oscillatoriales cyanobacterium]|nr:MAG: methyl-accepting chemotaxis protein [Oscillatoriales cyanobacterium]
MFKNLSLEQRLITAFGFTGGITLVVALVGWSGTFRLSKHIDTFANTVAPSLDGIWAVNEGQTQIESAERALVNPSTTLQERQAELTRINNAWQQINAGFEEYDKTVLTAEEEKKYQALKIAWANWKQNHTLLLTLHQQYQQLSAASGVAGSVPANRINDADVLLRQLQDRARANRQSFDAATSLLLDILKINQDVGKAAEIQSLAEMQRTSLFAIIGMIAGPLLAISFGIYFARTIAKPLGAKIAGVVKVAQQISDGDLTATVIASDAVDEVGQLQGAFSKMNRNLNNLIRQVQQSGIQITTSITQIAASGKQLEATVNEQAASTNEVTATARNIAVTSQKLVTTMERVTELAQETVTSASSSQADLMHMESVMRELTEATRSISSKLGIMSEKASNINSVVTTITKVADQTNLLSLNAAIEAEKAGEYGAGFAVVAREIRRLADQTAVATLEIEQMVKDMQASVSVGVMEMDKFNRTVHDSVEDVERISGQMADAISRVQSLTPRFAEVSYSMEEQSQGAQQIGEAMEQLSQASQQTADALRETNGALSQLTDAARSLQREVAAFKVQN